MLAVQPPSEGTVTMTYDGDHLRRRREDGSGITKCVWDGPQVLLETNGNNVTQARYTLAPLNYGDLVSQRRSNATRFYHFDALGTTRALSDSAAAITDTYLYDAWGTVLASSAPTVNPYQYVGKLGYAKESGVGGCYVRRRYYRAGVGRFVSRGPVGSAGAAGYAYAAGNPVRYSDPLGLNAGWLFVCGVPKPGFIDRCLSFGMAHFWWCRGCGVACASGCGIADFECLAMCTLRQTFCQSNGGHYVF